MRLVKALALGMAISAVMLGIWVVVAVIDSGEPERRAVTATMIGATPTPSPTPILTPTPSPTPIPTPVPTPTSEQTPMVAQPPEVEFKQGVGYSMDDGVVVRAAPTSESQQVGTLGFWEEVQITSVVQGQMWLNRNQYISPFGSFADWVNKWYELKRGGYVYSAFVFIPKPGEKSPSISCQNKWVEVYRSDQVLHAFCDGKDIFQAPVGIGMPWTPTPLGEYEVWTKILNETMSGADYHVQNVLLTQYFTSVGHALHLDWWHGDHYFGNQSTSHGCVGLQLHNAQWVWLFGFEGMKVIIYE